MIVNLFRRTQVVSILSVLLLCIFFWMGVSFHQTPLDSFSWSPLFDFLISPIHKFTLLEKTLTTALVFWQCLYVNKIIVGQKIISTNSFYPAFFYLLILSFWPGVLNLSSDLVAVSFILIAIHTTFSTYLSRDAYSQIFKISFYLSLATLLHPPFFVFIPLCWIGMSIFSQVEWRHWVLSVIAIASPWIVLISFCTYFNIQQLELHHFCKFIFADELTTTFTSNTRVSLLVLGFLFLISIYELIRSLNRKSIKARKSYIFIVWVTVLFIPYSYLNPSYIWNEIVIFSIPFSIIISNYFYYSIRSTWLNFMGFVLFALLFISHYCSVN
tara:strand:- start:681 stop:1661 length:981 start_codon:yes stop_codon:yes gene_type:complete